MTAQVSPLGHAIRAIVGKRLSTAATTGGICAISGRMRKGTYTQGLRSARSARRQGAEQTEPQTHRRVLKRYGRPKPAMGLSAIAVVESGAQVLGVRIEQVIEDHAARVTRGVNPAAGACRLSRSAGS